VSFGAAGENDVSPSKVNDSDVTIIGRYGGDMRSRWVCSTDGSGEGGGISGSGFSA
jgi:hypothetical protein